MEPLYILAIGVMASVAAYLLMSRNVLRMVLGLLLLGNSANLTIFVAGRMSSSLPPLIAAGETTIANSANPLPQALILTAIVISFALTAFTVVLLQKSHERLHILDTDEMRFAEPVQDADSAPMAGRSGDNEHAVTKVTRAEPAPVSDMVENDTRGDTEAKQ